MFEVCEDMLGLYLSTCSGVFYPEVVSDGDVVLDSVVVKPFELKRPAQHLFTDEENAEAQERLKKIEEEEAKKLVIVPEHKRHTGKRTIDYSNLDVVEDVIDPREVLDAPEDYVLMGEETTDTLVTEPKKLYIRRNRRRKYALKATLQQAEGDRKAMVIAPCPKSLAVLQKSPLWRISKCRSSSTTCLTIW